MTLVAWPFPKLPALVSPPGGYAGITWTQSLRDTQLNCQKLVYTQVCPFQYKGMVLYSAVSSPLDRSKRFTLSSPGRPVHSNTNSASLGSILAMQQLRNDYSLTFPPLSIARYSFIQLSRLRRREENENAKTSKR